MKNDKKNRLKRKKQNRNQKRRKKMMDGSLIQDLIQIRKIQNQTKQKRINQAINPKNLQLERAKRRITRMTGKQIQISERYPTEI